MPESAEHGLRGRTDLVGSRPVETISRVAAKCGEPKSCSTWACCDGLVTRNKDQRCLAYHAPRCFTCPSSLPDPQRLLLAATLRYVCTLDHQPRMVAMQTTP